MEGEPNMTELVTTRKNKMLTLSDTTRLTYDLSEIEGADAIVISIGSQGLDSLLSELSPYKIDGKIIILCMKGIEIGTGRRLTEIVYDKLGDRCKVAVWLGPGHPQEFTKGRPNCMVIDSKDENVKRHLVKEFSSPLIRFYYGTDLIGNEIGAAAKNVIGIAAGMLDGMELSTLKGALMSRGTREVSRLIDAMGGNPFSAYGLCHLGDYEATVFSPYSHNRLYGEKFVRGEAYGELAEGYYTAAALHRLAQEHHVELPICETVYRVLYEGGDVKEALGALFQRSLKKEF
jgi:glycerol-3-phosphate dehydrogenase (NAD(P)+)